MADPRFVAVVKRACETSVTVAPVLAELAGRVDLEVWSQDDPGFPSGVEVGDDRSLAQSFRLDIETVPTLIRFDGDLETGRAIGWHRTAWTDLVGSPLGHDLPDVRPGCGSRSREPGVHEQLVARYGDPGLTARTVAVDDWADPVEMTYDRGWTDGLPVVPPTDARILRMLAGTSRRPDEIVGAVPPNLAPCTVEKVAINAVMAGCRPEYLPVVLAAVEAAIDPLFTMHGLLCTTCFSSPIVVVNGPITRSIGMNSGINALGQGNRANATIGRALQLVVRNVGGGVPGELDRATLGGPGKYTFCLAEDERHPDWTPLSVARGIEPGRSAVTLFQGDGVQGFIDQRSRTADELTRSLAMSLAAVGHPKLAEFTNALLVLSPEHHGIFAAAGWGRARVEHELHAALVRPGADLVRGAGGVGEGIDPSRAGEDVAKFWPDGLLIARAGGEAGLYSAICAGWTGGRFRDESKPVTREVRP
ncbi:MAG: thioredoxin [Actinomycetota bacterium]